MYFAPCAPSTSPALTAAFRARSKRWRGSRRRQRGPPAASSSRSLFRRRQLVKCLTQTRVKKSLLEWFTFSGASIKYSIHSEESHCKQVVRRQTKTDSKSIAFFHAAAGVYPATNMMYDSPLAIQSPPNWWAGKENSVDIGFILDFSEPVRIEYIVIRNGYSGGYDWYERMTRFLILEHYFGSLEESSRPGIQL